MIILENNYLCQAPKEAISKAAKVCTDLMRHLASLGKELRHVFHPAVLAVQYSTVQYSTVQCGAVQCSAQQ